MTEMKYKRNFCIVAHIDHGKSTLSDRLIQKAQIIDDRKMMNQILDNMDIERERGITIKSQAVTIPYHAKDGHDYELNFVDTPGHVDFSYEVSRAIASCEGALLLIDATQGVESQTVSNMYMALEQDLTMVPVINKIDLASADIESCKNQIDNEKKDNLIKSFYMLSDEDKKDVIENKSNYSLDEIEAKLSVICCRKKVSFDLEDKNAETQNEVPATTFNLSDTDDGAPAWITAARNAKNNCNN